MRKELIIEGKRLVEVEYHTHRHGCRMVERIMSASPSAPTKPFKGKNWYAEKSKRRTERVEENEARKHMKELMELAKETKSSLEESFFINKLKWSGLVRSL